MTNEAFDRAVKALQDMDNKNELSSEDIVRTVLEAVREPSYDMALRGFNELDGSPFPHSAANCFKAMVDELLKP